MQLIKDRALVDDCWNHITSDDLAPAEGACIFTFAHWLEIKDTLAKELMVGIQLTGDDDIKAVAKYLAHFDLIALSFPTFVDGRCYSFAKLLRSRFGFTKEIRATGDVLFDQLAYMERCGINAFEIQDGVDGKSLLKAFSEFSEHYQPSGKLKSVAMLRHNIVQ